MRIHDRLALTHHKLLAVYEVNRLEQDTSAASHASAHVSTPLTGYADGVGAAVVTLLSSSGIVKGRSVGSDRVNVVVKSSRVAVTVTSALLAFWNGRPVVPVMVNNEDKASVPVGDVKVKVAVVLGPVKVKVDTS